MTDAANTTANQAATNAAAPPPVSAKPAPKFIPIAAPHDHYSGPATGLSTEKGDSWLSAVGKINTYFEHLFTASKGAVVSDAPEVETVAKADFDALKADYEELKAKVETFFGSPAAVAGDPPPPPPPNPPADPAAPQI